MFQKQMDKKFKAVLFIRGHDHDIALLDSPVNEIGRPIRGKLRYAGYAFDARAVITLCSSNIAHPVFWASPPGFWSCAIIETTRFAVTAMSADPGHNDELPREITRTMELTKAETGAMKKAEKEPQIASPPPKKTTSPSPPVVIEQKMEPPKEKKPKEKEDVAKSVAPGGGIMTNVNILTAEIQKTNEAIHVKGYGKIPVVGAYWHMIHSKLEARLVMEWKLVVEQAVAKHSEIVSIQQSSNIPQFLSLFGYSQKPNLDSFVLYSVFLTSLPPVFGELQKILGDEPETAMLIAEDAEQFAEDDGSGARRYQSGKSPLDLDAKMKDIRKAVDAGRDRIMDLLSQIGVKN